MKFDTFELKICVCHSPADNQSYGEFESKINGLTSNLIKNQYEFDSKFVISYW